MARDVRKIVNVLLVSVVDFYGGKDVGNAAEILIARDLRNASKTVFCKYIMLGRLIIILYVIDN